MFEKRLWVSALILVVVIVGGFALSVPRAQEVLEPANTSQTTPVISMLALRDSFKNGVHTIKGRITVADVCTTITADVSLQDGRIIVAVSTPEDVRVCLKIPTELPFTVSIKAPADAPLVATINGVPATVTAP